MTFFNVVGSWASFAYAHSHWCHWELLQFAVDAMNAIRGISRRFCGDFIEDKPKDYYNVCSRCERLVVISRGVHGRLLPLLVYDNGRM